MTSSQRRHGACQTSSMLPEVGAVPTDESPNGVFIGLESWLMELDDHLENALIVG